MNTRTPRPFPDVQGHCPACRWESLFLGAGGYVTCSRIECPDPCAATDLLERRDCGELPGDELQGLGVRPIGPCVLLHGHGDPEHEDPRGVRWSRLRQSPQTAAAAPAPDAPGTAPGARESVEHPLPGVLGTLGG